MPTPVAALPSSYRDPSGFIFQKSGIIYRQVNTIFKEDFDLFVKSGCYDQLVKQGLLIPHKVINENFTETGDWYTTLRPEKIAFISYPFEWSFDMLKDAALLTLRLLKEAIPFGISLKDATPYNIQWQNGHLIFIDTLSFAKYDETKPWIAYRQFCECFLAPLLLMYYHQLPLQQLMLAYPEGVPLMVAKSLLPFKSKLSLHTYLHIHLHAQISTKPSKKPNVIFSKQKLLNLLASLESLIIKLQLPPLPSTWYGYYEEASQRKDYLEEKKKIILHWFTDLQNVATCADLGANEGAFSFLAAERNIKTIAADFDPYCVNKLYSQIKENGQKNIQPLILDLANPSAAIGVNNEERQSFLERADFDLVLALALVHHLAIGKNIPFEMIADFFARMTKQLIIEFVPKQDDKVQLMLKNKQDIYTAYNEHNFEKHFQRLFTIEKKEPISSTGRILYFMKRKQPVQ